MNVGMISGLAVILCSFSLCCEKASTLNLQIADSNRLDNGGSVPKLTLTPHPVTKLDPYQLHLVPSQVVLAQDELKAVNTAMRAFDNEKKIPAGKKDLGNYRLEFRQDDRVIMVSIFAVREPDMSYVGGETDKGVDVTFVVSKTDGTLISTVFYK
ncbi:MAG: hypothetical protein ACRD6X_20620 [Pyrinomonadaceae bacterium]